jgi:hypothetical protein
MSEQGITREQILGELNRSSHGKLAEYAPVIGQASKTDPEFVAHVIAWDFTNGQIKDSKIALPVLTLGEREFPDELVENSLAHLALQPPRELLKALKFSIEYSVPARRQHKLEQIIRAYLMQREREPGKWSRLAVRHRRSLKSLYSLTHCRMPEWASDILHDGKYAPGSIFADIAMLSEMDPKQVAATIQKWHLSPLVVSGAMTGAKAKQQESAVVQAGMEQMSDTEVVTRAKSLEKKGLSRDPSLKETFRKKVAKATKSTKATLKTSVAAEEVEDESLKTMLKELQERQIAAQKASGRGIEGNWLVISDKSQSQDAAIETGKHVAAAIAKFVTGRVWLAFCDTGAAATEVTGMELGKIQAGSKFIHALGSTSYGVGLHWAIQKGLDLDGVVIVGDGGENSPPLFANMIQDYKRKHDKDLPVYLYKTFCEPMYARTSGGNPENFAKWMNQYNIPFTTFDLTHGKIDYYSLPNLVQSMNANRYGVVDRIMACPLLTFEQIGLEIGKEKVHA